MAISGKKSDWSFVVAAGYNELDFRATNDSVRPGSAGLRSLQAPINPLTAYENAEAVLTGQPSVEGYETTMEFWAKPTGATVDHYTVAGIRVNSGMTGGFRALIHNDDTVIRTASLENIADDLIKCVGNYSAEGATGWTKYRLSTSDKTGYPSALIEVSIGDVWRKRAYLSDRSGSISTAASGSFSFGIRNIASVGDVKSRFDDIDIFAAGLNDTSPLPFSTSFENGSWSNEYLGYQGPTSIARTIVIDSRYGALGSNSLNLTNNATGVATAYLNLAISDGPDRRVSSFFKFIETTSAVEMSLRSVSRASTSQSSEYAISIDPSLDTVTVLRKGFTGASVSLAATALNMTASNWYGFRFTATDGATTNLVVDYNVTGPSSPNWINLMSTSDASTALLGQEGMATLTIPISVSGSVRIDDFNSSKV